MARNTSPYTIGSRGSVKGMVFSSAFGVSYFKTRPETISNPRTDGQTSQRLALALVTATWQQIQSFGNIAYKKRAVRMSAYNQFAKQNLAQSRMTIDLVTKIATWLPSSLEVKPNPSQQGTSNAGLTISQLSGTISGLPSTRSFSLYAIAQSSSGLVGDVYKLNFTTDSLGEYDVTILANSFNLNNMSSCFYSIVDIVTGEVSNFSSFV